MTNRYITLENRRIIAISGADRLTFLQGLITQDVLKVTSEKAVYSLLLNAQGKFMHDFFIMQHDENTLWLDSEETHTDAIFKTLSFYKLRADVHIEVKQDIMVMAAMGDVASLDLPEEPGRQTALPEMPEAIAFVDPRHQKLGARLIASKSFGESWLQQRGFALTMSEDYLCNRLNLGIPEGDKDNIPEKTLPLENGLDHLNAIDFEKGCYVGQEVTARTKHRAQLRKQLYIVRAETRQNLPEAGADILQGERVIGRMGSSHESLGIALIRIDAVKSGEILHATDIPLHVIPPEWANIK